MSVLRCLSDPGSVVGLKREAESVPVWQLRALVNAGWIVPEINRSFLVDVDSLLSVIFYRERTGLSEETLHEITKALSNLRRATEPRGIQGLHVDKVIMDEVVDLD